MNVDQAWVLALDCPGNIRTDVPSSHYSLAMIRDDPYFSFLGSSTGQHEFMLRKQQEAARG